MDLLIKNGLVIDGTGKTARRKADVAIERGKITKVAPNIAAPKNIKVIEAEGKIVAPGFIDIQNHSDSYWTIFDQPEQTSLLAQGITTIVIGNCGASLAPLSAPESIKTIQKWHNLAGVNINWTTFAEFLQALPKNLGVNVASLVGHETLRRGLLKDEVRHATIAEIQIMDKLLWQALSQGAFGVSMGLVYAHEVSSNMDELEQLAKNLKTRGAYLSVHLRSETGHVLESISEVIEIAQKAEVSLKISHFKIRGSRNWHLAEQALQLIESAFHKGLDISFDVYPYDTSWNVLYTYLPKWAYEGGRAEILKMVGSEFERRKILEFLKAQDHDYKNIVISEATNSQAFVGKSLSQIAANANVTEAEALLNVLSASQAQAMVLDHNLSSDTVAEFMANPLAMIATDGAGHNKLSENLVHPRCFGAMPKFLSWVHTSKKITWEDAIRKITAEPARLLGLADRGNLFENSAADVVVFDPEKVSDKTDYTKPEQMPEGIESVIVNGRLAFESGKPVGSFGTVLRKI